MRIAMLGHKRVPSHEGGIEVVVEELAARMVEKGHQVTCFNRTGQHVSGKEYEVQKLDEYRGIRIRHVPTLDKKGLAAVTSSFFASLAAALGPYDVVHVHAEGPAAFCWLPMGWTGRGTSGRAASAPGTSTSARRSVPGSRTRSSYSTTAARPISATPITARPTTSPTASTARRMPRRSSSGNGLGWNTVPTCCIWAVWYRKRAATICAKPSGGSRPTKSWSLRAACPTPAIT